MEYNEEENIQFMTNESQKVRGTTIFLAELYMQLQNVSFIDFFSSAAY